MAAKKRKVKVQTFDEAIAALDSLHAALSAELDKQTVKLTERTFTADELRSRTAKWGAAETARIRAWEEREVKHVHAVANETVELVQEVCARRIEVGAGLITQRAGLLASVEEFGQALANLPREPVAQLTKKRAVYAERKRLCELLAESKIDVPSARAVIEWIEPPALSAEFDEKAAATGGHLASSVFAGAKATLARARRTPGTPLREFPAVPKLDEAKGLRSIQVGDKPNVFVGLDDNTIVVGFLGVAALQVWDLAAGKLAREFEGKGRYCYSVINLSDERIAAAWYNGSQHVVAVFDSATGKQQYELTGFEERTLALALVEDHLLSMCQDKTLRVWSQDSGGKFAETANFTTTATPQGMMTVLTSSTVAMSMRDPGQIEIWDWKQGKCVRTLSGFGGNFVFGHALLSDGRFVTADWAGTIKLGFLDDWTAAKSVLNGSGIIGVLACQDGSFVTTDERSHIKLWRDGTCEASVPGGFTGVYYGVPLAVIGRRLIVVGSGNTLRVFE